MFGNIWIHLRKNMLVTDSHIINVNMVFCLYMMLWEQQLSLLVSSEGFYISTVLRLFQSMVTL